MPDSNPIPAYDASRYLLGFGLFLVAVGVFLIHRIKRHLSRPLSADDPSPDEFNLEPMTAERRELDAKLARLYELRGRWISQGLKPPEDSEYQELERWRLREIQRGTIDLYRPSV